MSCRGRRPLRPEEVLEYFQVLARFSDRAKLVEYARSHEGRPLVWDQRGNGDPRFVGGITDIGAFERVGLIFADGFESGDVSGWSGSSP